jgi:hypothetical protein
MNPKQIGTDQRSVPVFLTMVTRSARLCFSKRHSDLHCFIPSDNVQSNLIAWLEFEQCVDVGMGFVQRDIPNLRDDIPFLQTGLISGAVLCHSRDVDPLLGR